MKKKQLVCSALAAAMMLSTAAPGASAASFSDSAGHWGESSIDRWSNSGVLNGIDNAFNPNASITRGEMATILAEMLGLEERASDTYPDLNGGWYTDAMLKCAAAGIMTGDDHGQMRPYDSVTGAEIAVILNKALDLSSSRSNYPATTAGYVKPWAQSYVDAITSRGIAVGNDGGIFQPMEATSRAAFVSMLDRAVDTYISSPGTYSADGLTIINTTGTVTLTGTPTSVDITASSTGANVVLDRTHVSGPINVKGGRVHLTARSATLNDTQVKGYGCSIALEGNTNGGTVQLSSGAGSTSVSIASTAQAGQIISDASSTTIDIYGDVNNIKLDSGAMSSSINVRSGAKVESVTSEANDVNISGNGTLRRADIYGTNNRVTTPGTTINRGPTTSTVTNTSKRSVVRRRPSYSDRYTVNFYYDDGSGNSHRLYTSSRVYNGNTVGTVSEPIYNGDQIFDHWEYERYYYDDGYYYDYYYYDWDYWYKDGNWVWDSSEQAYHLRSSDLWYDSSRNEYFVLRNGRRVVVSGSSLYDYYDRYGYYYDGYYYDGGYWRESDDWVWSRAKNAYYNSFGDVYHDSNGYFIMSSGSKRYISASEARDRLGAYYYDDYYYRNGYYRDGYYKDGRWYYYDKNGTYRDGYYKDGRWYYYDSDRYYYNYRVGDRFNFSDRIYGNVDLVARWRPCVSTSDPDQVQNLLNASGSTPVKYSGTQALGYLNLNGKELYLVNPVARGTFTGGGSVTGPGKNGSTSTPGTNPGGSTESLEQSITTAMNNIGTFNGTTCQVTESGTVVSDATLMRIANQLATLAKKLSVGDTMTVGNATNTINVTSTTSPETIAQQLAKDRTANANTSVVITPNGGTATTYTIQYNVASSGSSKTDRVNKAKLLLRDKGIHSNCLIEASALNTAISDTFNDAAVNPSGTTEPVSVVAYNGSNSLTSSDITSLTPGTKVTVKVDGADFATNITIADTKANGIAAAQTAFEAALGISGTTATVTEATYNTAYNAAVAALRNSMATTSDITVNKTLDGENRLTSITVAFDSGNTYNITIDPPVQKSKVVQQTNSLITGEGEEQDPPLGEDKEQDPPLGEDKEQNPPADEDEEQDLPAGEDEKPELPAGEDEKPTVSVETVVNAFGLTGGTVTSAQLNSAITAANAAAAGTDIEVSIHYDGNQATVTIGNQTFTFTVQDEQPQDPPQPPEGGVGDENNNSEEVVE